MYDRGQQMGHAWYATIGAGLALSFGLAVTFLLMSWK